MFTEDHWEQIPGAADAELLPGQGRGSLSRATTNALGLTLEKIRDGEPAHGVLRPGEPFQLSLYPAGTVVNFVDEELKQITPDQKHDIINDELRLHYGRQPAEFDEIFTEVVGKGPRAIGQTNIAVLGETENGPATYTRQVRWGVIMPALTLLAQKDEVEGRRLFTASAFAIDSGHPMYYYVCHLQRWREWVNGQTYQISEKDDATTAERRIGQTSINFPAHAPSSRVNPFDFIANLMLPRPAEQ